MKISNQGAANFQRTFIDPFFLFPDEALASVIRHNFNQDSIKAVIFDARTGDGNFCLDCGKLQYHQ
jgi:hydroxypyruvate isomerase